MGQKGYNAFIDNWSKEAHLKLYFEYLEKIAQSKFGNIPWKKS